MQSPFKLEKLRRLEDRSHLKSANGERTFFDPIEK